MSEPAATTTHSARGVLLCVDMAGVSRALLDDVSGLAATFRRIVTQIGATVMSSRIDLFEPEGASITLVLAESHATIHTYPEHCACMVDIFTCGDAIDPEHAMPLLTEALRPQRVHLQRVLRGVAPRRR